MLKEINTKKYFLILASILCFTDLMILLDVPVIRPILGFLCFTIIPGLLLLHILGLNELEPFKRLTFSVGLSVAFLMFSGLLSNSLFPYISKPLSLLPLLSIFNLLLILFIFIAYKITKNSRVRANLTLGLESKMSSVLLFPILFPFLTVFGTHFMNYTGNNILILTMLFFVIIYVSIIILANKKVPHQTYPLAVLMISISLLLMLPLRSPHIDSQDINIEYILFKLALSENHWSPLSPPNNYNACLSVGMLPVVYKILLNMNGEYIYKIIYNLIFSFTPLCLYFLFKQYINRVNAFIISFFFMSQYMFINLMYMIPRVEIALFFFALAITIFFDNVLNKLTKKILLLISIFSVIVSHYSTTYIFFIVLFSVLIILLLINLIKNLIGDLTIKTNLRVYTVLIFFVLLFFWYGQVTEVPFTMGVNFFERTFESLNMFFLQEARNPYMSNVMSGKGLTELPYQFFSTFFYVMNFVIVTGFFYVLKYKKHSFPIEYILMVLVMLGLIVSMMTLPYVSKKYNIIKLYLQAMVLIAPMIVFGVRAISKLLPLKYFTTFLILTILIVQFTCGTYILYQFFGIPYSYAFNSKGSTYDRLYVHDEEVAASKWLGNYDSLSYRHIYTDIYGLKRVLGHGCGDRWESSPTYNSAFIYDKKSPFAEGKPLIKEGYIFLRYQNVVDEELIPKQSGIPYHQDIHDISEYKNFLSSKIYGNGGSEIWMSESQV